MKRICIFFYLMSLITFIYAEEIYYTVKEETIPTYINFYLDPLMPGEKIRLSFSNQRIYGGFQVGYYIEYPNTIGYVDADALFIDGSDSFDKNICYDKKLGVIESDVWIPTYYIPVLEKDDPELLLQYEKHLTKFDSSELNWKRRNMYDPTSFWLNDHAIFQLNPLIGRFSAFHITNLINTGSGIYYGMMITDIEDNKGIRADGLENISNQTEYAFYIHFKNNRLRIYIEGEDQPKWDLMKVSKEFTDILQQFPYEGSWSGNQDFKKYLSDDIFDSWPIVSLTELKKKINMLEINVPTSPTHVVSENVRLRFLPGTSTEIIKTLNAGIKVYKIRDGLIQTIDGITAPWVYIQTEDGMRGWCFSGYLATYPEEPVLSTNISINTDKPTESNPNIIKNTSNKTNTSIPLILLIIGGGILVIGLNIFLFIKMKKK